MPFDSVDNTAAGLGLAGLAGVLGSNSFGGVYQSGEQMHALHNKWKALANKVDIANLPIEEQAAAFREYADVARNAARQKMLGVVPVSAISTTIFPTVGTSGPTLKTRLRNADFVRAHHKLFADPLNSDSKLQQHLLQDNMMGMDRNTNIYKKYFGQDPANSVEAGHARAAEEVFHANGLSLEEKLRRLQDLKGNTRAQLLLDDIRTKYAPKFIQDFLSGPHAHVRDYGTMARTVSKNLSKGFRTGGNLAMVGALGLGLANQFTKQSSLKTADETNPYGVAAGAGLTGLGALAASSGASGFLKQRPTENSIVFSYGANPVWGNGHKEPSKVIKKLLQANDPELVAYSEKYPWLKEDRFKKTIMDEAVRDADSISSKQLHSPYRLAIDTGLGHGMVMDKLTSRAHPAEHTLAYQTDSLPNLYGKLKMPHSATYPVLYGIDSIAPGHLAQNMDSVVSGLSNGTDMITHGDGAVSHRILGMRPHHTGFAYTPAVDPVTMIKLHELNQLSDQERLAKRTAMIDQMIASETDPAVKAQLESIKGKKRLITITGSGRGDYVVARTKMLAEKLKAAGIADTGILALAAGAHGTPQMHFLNGLQDAVAVGKLPKDTFTGLQNLSDLNWGGTGASTVAESSVSKNKQLIPSKWGQHVNTTGQAEISKYWNQILEEAQAGGHGFTPDKATALKDYLAKTEAANYKAPLDFYNSGNMQHALNRGFVQGNNADDVIKALLDTNNATHAERAGKMFEEYSKAVPKLRDIIHGQLTEGLGAQRFRKFAPRSLLGLGMLGAGLYTGLGSLGNKEPSLIDKLRGYIS